MHKSSRESTISSRQTYLEEALGTRTTCVHNSLGDPLSIELRDLLDELVVFEQDWPCGGDTKSQGGLQGSLCQNPTRLLLDKSFGVKWPGIPRIPTVSEELLFQTGAPEFVVQYGLL